MFVFLLVGILVSPVASAATGSTKLLDTQILFDKAGKGKVSYQGHDKDAKQVEGSKIESALVFYAYAMNQVPEGQRNPLMNQVQGIVTKVVTTDGLKRADILSGNPLVENVGSDSGDKGFNLLYARETGKGNILEVKPVEGSGTLWGPAVFYYFQDLVQNLSDNGVRLMVIAIGGMNKWYREVGKASDVASVSQAPVYGLNIALDIFSKISGEKI